MKKLIAGLTTIMLLGWGAGDIQAQDWTWECPVLVDDMPPLLDEISADPTEEYTLYGIAGGEVVKIILDPPATCPEMEASPGSESTVNDIVVGPTGQAFVCTNDIVGYYQEGYPLDQLEGRPLLPTDGDEIIAGDYIRISVGHGGRLFVLYQTPPAPADPIKQYILVGNPPVITEGVTISFKPRSLNLKSKGKWVSCHIGPPDGYDATEIESNSVKITDISIEGVAQPYVGPDIEVPADAPMEVEDGKLKVKFIRSEVIEAIQGLLSGDEGKFVRATLTVQGLVDGQYFEGTDTIKVKTGQKKKKKKKK